MTTILSVMLAAPALVSASVTTSPTLPDTSCASAVGVGRADIPHAYETGNGIITFTNDACPDHYSGELGFGVGGVWFFSRAGPDANGDGDGVVTCYGSTDPTAGPTTGHHGSHTTINVLDDYTGSPTFTVTRDYNRTTNNPTVAGTGNQAGDLDCGDSLVEPCDPNDPTQYTTAPGCNPLDFSAPAVGSWTAPTTLGDHAGADGAIVIFIDTTTGGSTGSTGAAWTSGSNVPITSCAFAPGVDPDGVARTWTCTYYDRSTGCLYTYRSFSSSPHKPIPRDYVVSTVCGLWD